MKCTAGLRFEIKNSVNRLCLVNGVVIYEVWELFILMDVVLESENEGLCERNNSMYMLL